ncbi:hypothetical protein BGZ54_009981 [Gamsiella multidivaricata]|nr:hypothetical protein BGZ54_009981 [Gamsiella multidivaricata]
MNANAGRPGINQGVSIGGPGLNAAAAPPKKKDPYATAWRTYSKIAEELQLLNPDGSLYPISKEAILKYLHHQSKRIKSSNLHWYVNGLKKHQENLGFPWDDVRYDEQVVGLLKELTLHPVTMNENGEDDGHGHAYNSQPNRQRQTSSTGIYLSGKSSHHYSSSSIDTTRIANLSISQPPLHHSQQQQQHQGQQNLQQMSHSSSYGAVGQTEQHQSHRHYLQQPMQQQQQQQMHMQSSRIQQAPPPKPYYHSAPIQLAHHTRTPSVQDMIYQSGGGHHRSPSDSISSPVDAKSLRLVSIGNPASALTKRKRDDFGCIKRRVPLFMGIGGEENELDELQGDEVKDNDFDLNERRAHDMDHFDDLDDSNRFQSLKRRASTGTLLSQARESAIKSVPVPFAVNQHGLSQYRYQKTHLRDSSTSSNSSITHRPKGDQHLRSSSPDLGDDEGHYALRRGLRDSPLDSTSPTSPVVGQPHLIDEQGLSQQQYRHLSNGGAVASSTTGAATAPLPSSSTTTAGTTGGTTGKTTVQFSEVVECAQLLQAKYGNRCKDHPWGCVKTTENRHLELTIKMYLDWAGLVASERLTMDDLPDLPEFRISHPIVGGTLKRMTSTPFISSATSRLSAGTSDGVSSLSSASFATMTRHQATADNPSSPGLSGRIYLGPYRSPSSSPPIHVLHHDKDLTTDESSLLSRTRSPPLSAAAQRSIPSPPPGISEGDGVGGNNGHVVPPYHARARKMPSIPVLGHHLRHQSSGHRLQEEHQQQHHIRPTVSASVASSPSSEADLSDEDELEEDEETIDISHYALSPWATAPSAKEMRARANIGNSTTMQQQPQKGVSSALKASDTLQLEENRSEKQTKANEDATDMAVDTEDVVSVIGEISDVPGAGPETTTMIIGTAHSRGTSVDAAAKVLDSMIIGRPGDSENFAAEDDQGPGLKDMHPSAVLDAAEPTLEELSNIIGGHRHEHEARVKNNGLDQDQNLGRQDDARRTLNREENVMMET